MQSYLHKKNYTDSSLILLSVLIMEFCKYAIVTKD